MPLHPDFPVVEARYQLTEDWSVTLPSKFNRRVEESDLVIWKPGFTIWLSIWGNDKLESKEERLVWITEDSSSEASDVLTETGNGVLRYSYRLKESSEDNREAAFYGFSIGVNGHVQMAVYFDSPDSLNEAEEIWRSLEENRKEG